MTSQKYQVVVSPVRELSLVGAADINYWTSSLRPFGMHPTVCNGQAELIISAAQMKFWGVRFTELSISIVVSRQEGGESRDGLFLMQAWNSFGPFAFVERNFLHAPYDRGCVTLTGDPPHEFAVAKTADAEPWVRGSLASRPMLNRDEQWWEGPIFLPVPRGRQRRYFMARVGGRTATIRFDEAVDSLQIDGLSKYGVFGDLAESDFQAGEWFVRPQAIHCKGKTRRLDADGWPELLGTEAVGGLSSSGG